MPSTTGIRRRLSPALLAGAPYRIGDRMADRYLVKDAIGLGPLGYVFRATDEQQGIDVAVKMIHPRFVQTAEEREAFARAVEPARRFLQPSLARVHDLGVDQGWPYVTYSFLDGLTLRRMIDSRLAKGQTFTLEEVEPFLGQLAAALEASHPVGAHADLKPENVIILPDMLPGPGLGRRAGAAATSRSCRRSGRSPPTATSRPRSWPAPSPSPRADLYALGVLVGEMLTGLTPDEDIPELRLTTPELPEAVEGFYRRALNERPEARFRSVRELYEEFLSLLAPRPRRPRPPVPPGGAGEEVPAQVEQLEPLPEHVPRRSAPPPSPSRCAGSAERAPVPEPAPDAEPIAAAALPRFESQAPSPPPHHPRGHRARAGRLDRSVRRPGTPPSADPIPRFGRWRALRLWDADESVPGEQRPAAPAEPAPPRPRARAPVSREPALALVDTAEPPRNGAGGLEHPDDEADRAVARLIEMDDGPALTVEGVGDEPLLAEALGVDLVVDGDEPVPARRRYRPQRSPRARRPGGCRSAAAAVCPVAASPVVPTPVREVPRLVPESRPWAVTHILRPIVATRRVPRRSRPRPPSGRCRSAGHRHAGALPPRPPSRRVLASVPRLSPIGPVTPAAVAATAPTPLTVVPEPSPTRQEKIVAPPPPPRR